MPLISICPSFSSDWLRSRDLDNIKKELEWIRPIEFIPERMNSLSFKDPSLNEECPFRMIDRDIRISIFSRLRPEDVIALRLTCKKFFNDIYHAREIAEGYWKNNQRNPIALRWLLTDPRRAVELHKEIAEESPHRVLIYYRGFKPSKTMPQPDSTNEMVNDYVRQFSVSPFLRQLIRRVMLAADPARDFRQVSLTALIVEHDEEFQKELIHIMITPITGWQYLDEMRDLLRISHHKTQLTYYKARLMCSKLYKLGCDNYWAIDEFNELSRLSRIFHFRTLRIKDIHKTLKNDSAPIWACYTDRWETCLSYYYAIKSNPSEPALAKRAEMFGNYLSALPTLPSKSFLRDLYQIAGNYYESQKDFKNARRCWGEIQDHMGEPILQALGTWQTLLITPFYQLLVENEDKSVLGEYEKLADQLQQRLKEKFSNDLNRLFTLIKLSEIILIYGDKTKFEQIETYLDESAKLFPHDRISVVISFAGISEDSVEIWKDKLISLRTALAIYQEKFDVALTLMKQNHDGYLEDIAIHILAAKRQMDHPNFPKDLVKIIGNFISESTLSWPLVNGLCKAVDAESFNHTPPLQIAMLMNEVFIDKFLKGHPLVALYWKARLKECRTTNYFGLLPEGEKK